MTLDEILKRFPNASRSTIARNLSVDIRPVQTDDAKREPGPLVGSVEAPKVRAKNVARSRPVLRVALIGLCSRELDDDNFANACKPLRDAIAEWLGMNDSRKNIRWTYGQCQTGGEEGVIVRIETIFTKGS